MNLIKRFNQNHSLTSFVLMCAVIAVLIVGLMMATQPPQITHAQFADLTAAQTQYSNIVGTQLDACGLCHTATFGFNDFGMAYAMSGKNFAGIEGQDSDGDGFTNIEEILALTFPGDAASKPAATPPPPPPPGNIAVSVSGPANVSVGDEFDVEIVAQGADASSAIYGVQFELEFDPSTLQVVDGSLQPGSAMNPHLIALSDVENASGEAKLVFSLQGNVDGLTGDVVLATVRFRALNAGAGSLLALSESDLLLGTKDASSIPVSTISGLTVTVGEQGSNKATVSGQALMPGKTDHSGIAIKLGDNSFNATTNSSGDFSMTGVDEGTYSITAEAPGHLNAVCSNKAVSLPSTQLATLSLVPGDLNDDDLIDITDATTIGVDFGTGNSRSDLNGDGTVNVLDLILLANNYGTSGPSNWDC